MSLLVSLAIAATALHLLRQRCAHGRVPPGPVVDFEGVLYRVGETSIAVKRAEGGAKRTLICVPGFLENSGYYLDLYDGGSRDPDDSDELILINNANYHCPFDETKVEALDWEANPHRVGTIEHDGFLLAQTIRHLATTDNIVLHGHSRGGAVVLEAGRQFPDLMKSNRARITALLEAAVLPQGTPAGSNPGPLLSAVTGYMLPLVFTAIRIMGERALRRSPMMHPTNDVKAKVMKTLFHHPKDYATCVVNVSNIAAWQKQHHYDLYENYREILVLIGARDAVLSTRTMAASAERGAELNPELTIVHTTETNHFISIENPSAVHAALRGAATRRAERAAQVQPANEAQE